MATLLELGREAGVVKECIEGDVSRLLDVADKAPIAAFKFVNDYSGLDVHHYRDNKAMTKVLEMRNFPGVRLINTFSELEGQEPYDIMTMIYALHEFEKPVATLERSLGKLRDGGIFVFKDYDLLWVPELFESMGKGADWEKEFFSEYVFTNANEQNVLGLVRGRPLSDKRIRRNAAKGVEVEPRCVAQHTRFGMNYFLDMFSSLGIEELVLESHEIKISEGTFPKTMFYVGRKRGSK